MNNIDIVNTALERLEQLTAINAKWQQRGGVNEIDGEIDFYFRDKDLHYFIEIKRQVRNHQLPALLDQAKKYHPLMIIAEKIYPAVKEQLRKNKIPHLDIAGNFYINEPGNFIWIEGNKLTEAVETETNKAFTKTGLKVIFHLLTNPAAINLPYRRLAEATDVALGAIPGIMAGLKRGDFILPVDKVTNKLHKKKELLERWITGYADTLKPTLHLGTYVLWNEPGLQNWQQLNFDLDDGLWGAQPAAEKLTGNLKATTLTLYVNEKHMAFRKLRLVPDPEGYIFLYRKFWKDEQLKAEQTAPPLLVYADLIITDDPRCHEAAQLVYNKYLKNEFE